MMIPIMGEYFLDKDKNQWILMRRTACKGDLKKSIGKVKALGEHTEDQFAPEGFYYSLPQAAAGVVNRCEDIEADSFEELLEAYNTLIKQIADYMEAEYEDTNVQS